MFMNDVNKKEEIRAVAIRDLKSYGIKFRPKKSRQHVQTVKNYKVFKKPLENLRMETVTLPNGRQLIVPKIVHELCSFLLTKIQTEGLFRKGGSKSRQSELKLSLDAGCYLGTEHHEIDVANVLKTFFRDLPEPLIPFSHHELLLRCMILQSNAKETATLLACLLLPIVHLNALSYFMQFLKQVTDYSTFNKMDSYNLAVVFGPTLMPTEEKLVHDATLRMTKTCELFKLLIENASLIGLINSNIIDRIAQVPSSNEEKTNEISKKKKKRRSGSLTRMLSGLKKIVTQKTEEVIEPVPDLLRTPNLITSMKKRKIEGIPMKKRQEIVSSLPNGALLSTPFTPKRTPARDRDNNNGTNAINGQKNENVKQKGSLWSTKLKTTHKKTKDNSSSTSSIQRRWSAVSSAAGFKKKARRNSCTHLINEGKNDQNLEEDSSINKENISNDAREEEANYMRISKIEYEQIKNRVSAIEKRLSVELELQDSSLHTDSDTTPVHSVDCVEEVGKKYEETLEKSECLSPTTDQLAKRFSRELKIHKSPEEKRFRSPSARKIGSLRRKDRKSVRLGRTQTWCVTASSNPVVPTRKTIARPKNSHQSDQQKDFKNMENPQRIVSQSIKSSSNWKNAEGFFNTPENEPATIQATLDNCRASIARIRCQNAGMVMEKARLFDNLVDSTSSNERIAILKPKQPIIATNNGVTTKCHPPQINRIKTLRAEERRKKSMSPKKRPCRSPGIHRLNKMQMAKLQELCLNDATPKGTKKSVHSKSPRRLYKKLEPST